MVDKQLINSTASHGRWRRFGSWRGRYSKVQSHIIRLRLLWRVRSGTLVSMRQAITKHFLFLSGLVAASSLGVLLCTLLCEEDDFNMRRSLTDYLGDVLRDAGPAGEYMEV